MVLCDRKDERAMLNALSDDARAGRSGVLVMRGEPGVGKTALLEYAIDAASDLTVLHAVGVESESELAFAALHQLCAPMLERLDALPGPQRDALTITFGLSAGAVPDQFLTGLAVLSLLSEVADERPLLCVIDDAQWLDRASARLFAFVARRLLAESVVMLFAAREPSEELQGLPELAVEGLDDADARELLASVIPSPLDERIRDQLVKETRGNPLALLELPRGLTSAQLAAGSGLLGVKSTSGRIEESVLRRLRELPDDTQRWLLVAAADPAGDPTLLWRAVDRLALARDSFEPAERTGLVEVGAGVRFRHPLVRSAIYGAAAPEERRQVHRALAEATDAEVDPDRRAWHLAEATVSPDDDVAAELERSAGRAQARGGLAAAAAFLERAAALTVESSRRAERALMAARAKYEAGMLGDALALLATIESDALDDAKQARVHLLRAQIAFASRRGSDAASLLLEAAQSLEAIDPNLARATYLDALTAVLFAGRLMEGRSAIEVAKAARSATSPPESPRAWDLLLDGLALLIADGPSTGTPVLRRAVSAFRDGEEVTPEEELRWAWLAARVASFIWDHAGWDALTARQIQIAREAGALTVLPLTLSARAGVHLFAGDLATAATLIEESAGLAEATNSRVVPYAALALAAFRGREQEENGLIATTAKECISSGDGRGLMVAQWASALLCNGLARYDEALRFAEKAAEHPREHWFSTKMAPVELIEAASRTGNPERAIGALEWLAESTHASATDWGLGVEARSRALLSDGDSAESLYRQAIERLQRTRVRWELARGHLVYGEWLRRERRRLDAREQLRAALEMFTSMGAEGFAGRAEGELIATGERVRKHTVETRDELTSQEAQVAQLASEGLSNSEIGARLFISQHTVAYHLRKVFSKLDISSRSQLNKVLPPQPSSVLS